MLGGELEKVNSAYVTNGICSEECAGWLNSFINDKDQEVKPGDNGMINGVEINSEVNAEMKENYDGSYSSDNVYQAYKWGRFGSAYGGEGPGAEGGLEEGEMDGE